MRQEKGIGAYSALRFTAWQSYREQSFTRLLLCPGSVLSLDTNTIQIHCSPVVTSVSLNPVAPTSQPFPSITNVDISSKYYLSRQHLNYGHAQGEP